MNTNPDQEKAGRFLEDAMERALRSRNTVPIRNHVFDAPPYRVDFHVPSIRDHALPGLEIQVTMSLDDQPKLAAFQAGTSLYKDSVRLYVEVYASTVAPAAADAILALRRSMVLVGPQFTPWFLRVGPHGRTVTHSIDQRVKDTADLCQNADAHRRIGRVTGWQGHNAILCDLRGAIFAVPRRCFVDKAVRSKFWHHADARTVPNPEELYSFLPGALDESDTPQFLAFVASPQQIACGRTLADAEDLADRAKTAARPREQLIAICHGETYIALVRKLIAAEASLQAKKVELARTHPDKRQTEMFVHLKNLQHDLAQAHKDAAIERRKLKEYVRTT